MEAISGTGVDDDTAEFLAHNPPPSLVPRLHAIVIRKLDHVNPHLPWDIKSEKNNSSNINFQFFKYL